MDHLANLNLLCCGIPHRARCDCRLVDVVHDLDLVEGIVGRRLGDPAVVGEVEEERPRAGGGEFRAAVLLVEFCLVAAISRSVGRWILPDVVLQGKFRVADCGEVCIEARENNSPHISTTQQLYRRVPSLKDYHLPTNISGSTTIDQTVNSVPLVSLAEEC